MYNNTSFHFYCEIKVAKVDRSAHSWSLFLSSFWFIDTFDFIMLKIISNICEKKCCTRRKKQVSNDTLTSPYYDRLSTTITIRCLVLGPKVLISKTRNQLKYISFKDSNVDSQAYQDNFIHIRLMFFFSFKLDPYQLNNLYKGYY